MELGSHRNWGDVQGFAKMAICLNIYKLFFIIFDTKITHVAGTRTKGRQNPVCIRLLNNTTVDDLALQGDWTSKGMVLTNGVYNTPISARKNLNSAVGECNARVNIGAVACISIIKWRTHRGVNIVLQVNQILLLVIEEWCATWNFTIEYKGVYGLFATWLNLLTFVNRFKQS